MLPTNPILLVSVLNTKLRDFYDSLDSLCDDLDESYLDLVKTLDENGYIYNKELNKIVEK